MPIYEFKCSTGHITESIEKWNVKEIECMCGLPAKKIPSVRGANCVNEDADWIRTVTEVVDKDSKAPHVQTFLKDPTRENYKAWMKGEGIRPLEPGERNRPEPIDRKKRIDYMARKRQERNRIEIGR